MLVNIPYMDPMGMAKRLKLFGITYLVGKISRLNFYLGGPGRLSEEDVFPIEHCDFPASYVSLPEGRCFITSCLLIIW